jgi:hypothetical protein
MGDEETSAGAAPPPPPPPEVEQAVLLGHIEEAVSLYVRHTGIDPDTARTEVERIAAEHG